MLKRVLCMITLAVALSAGALVPMTAASANPVYTSVHCAGSTYFGRSFASYIHDSGNPWIAQASITEYLNGSCSGSTSQVADLAVAMRVDRSILGSWGTCYYGTGTNGSGGTRNNAAYVGPIGATGGPVCTASNWPAGLTRVLYSATVWVSGTPYTVTDTVYSD